MIDADRSLTLFSECFLGSQGTYNPEYLTYVRRQYLGMIKEWTLFCVFGMIERMDPMTSGYQCENLVDDLADYATHNKSSNKIMLGKYNQEGKSYIKSAQEHGMRYFSLDEYNYYAEKYGEQFVHQVNSSFVHKALNQGCEFYFSHNPINATGAFSLEVNWIIDYYTRQGKTVSFDEYGELFKLIVQ